MSDFRLATKLRDAHQMITDAWNDYLQDRTQNHWNPDHVKWQPAVGTKGAYEKAEPQATTDFKQMLTDIGNHNGKLSRNGYFYWVFNDAATIGRKRIASSQEKLP